MKRTKKLIRNKKNINGKKKLWLKGDSSPILLIVLLIGGIATLGAVSYSQSNTRQSNIASTSTIQQPTSQPLKMETFYVTPKPTEIPGKVCSTSVSDTMLVFDHSGSMGEGSIFGGNKISKAKAAATKFVDIVSANFKSRVGLTGFSNSSSLLATLMSNFTQVKSQINSLSPNGFTCIQCGIQTGNQNIAANKRLDIKQNAIILTDGKANRIVGSSNPAENIQAKQAAKDEAMKGFAESAITYYTIGFGDVDADLLQEIANATGGTAYIAANEGQLEQFFAAIAQQICK